MRLDISPGQHVKEIPIFSAREWNVIALNKYILNFSIHDRQGKVDEKRNQKETQSSETIYSNEYPN